jgi:hypothetical protein
MLTMNAVACPGHLCCVATYLQARAQFNKLRALWVERRTAAIDWVDRISDGMEKKPKARSTTNIL